ncbi:MAG: hypothetical protein JWP36_879 [Paucimonas sp.]|jgi:uncharacterized membrane protein|nr:hypothetical protein [Paucimonas sp.]
MAQEIVFDRELESFKSTAWWLYVFHGLSLAFSLGALSFIPLIISYLKRPDTAGTFVYSHHSWQIRSFWWYLVWMAVGALFIIPVITFPIAWMIWSIAWIWKAYRLIRGFLDLNANKPMPG